LDFLCSGFLPGSAGSLREKQKDWGRLAVAGLFEFLNLAYGQEQGKTSYMKVDSTESFASIMARMKAEKPEVEKEHSAVLNERYDLSDRPAQGVTMDRGNPIANGPTGEKFNWARFADHGIPDFRGAKASVGIVWHQRRFRASS
jgi:hypothetical protein